MRDSMSISENDRSQSGHGGSGSGSRQPSLRIRAPDSFGGKLPHFMIILYVLMAILVLLLMITVHEFGHYIAARILGFGIEEFSIGFGPPLFRKRKKNGELFSVRAFPLGGYCAFTGEEAETSKDVDSENTPETGESTDAGSVNKIPFDAQKPWKRLIVILSGAALNFISAFLFSFIFLLSSGYAVPVVTDLTVDPQTNAPYAAELRCGDEIIAVDGREIGIFDSFSSLTAEVPSDKTSVFTVLREGGQQDVTVVWRKMTVAGENGERVERELLGITLSYERRHLGFFSALGASFPYTFRLCGTIFRSFGMILTGQVALTDMTGPVGTVATMASYAQNDLLYLLFFLPLLACNLAIFNILPFPSLDGAKAVFLLIEWVRGKPIDKKIENTIHSVGLAALLIFVVAVDLIGFIVRLL